MIEGLKEADVMTEVGLLPDARDGVLNCLPLRIAASATARKSPGVATATAVTLMQAFKELGQQFPSIMAPLIYERDQYMVAVMRQLASRCSRCTLYSPSCLPSKAIMLLTCRLLSIANLQYTRILQISAVSAVPHVWLRSWAPDIWKESEATGRLT